MFIGHYALALAAKRAAPRTSLGTLFVAVQLADMLWPILLLLGWEHAHFEAGPNPFLVLWLDSIPISHSLLTLIAWGTLFAGLYHWHTGYARGALVVALAVVSHWVLDFVTHRPDMPLYPGGPKLGLGLWNSVAGTIVVEAAMFVFGVWMYLRATRARDAVGRYGLAALLTVLVLSYVGSLLGGAPPSMRAVEIGGIVFGWLFVWWAAWGDRHREGYGVAG
ncbi:MAG TPA: metal-dependent hydrolase [Gemmatimonadales bacterium]|nr:metal-dependent hydrolase [Gemmatimonadales bacterium]